VGGEGKKNNGEKGWFGDGEEKKKELCSVPVPEKKTASV